MRGSVQPPDVNILDDLCGSKAPLPATLSKPKTRRVQQMANCVEPDSKNLGDKI
jgi:hypothetical protein